MLKICALSKMSITKLGGKIKIQNNWKQRLQYQEKPLFFGRYGLILSIKFSLK